MSPHHLDDLSSQDPWTRAKALSRLTTDDLRDTTVLGHVLRMLGDDVQPSCPDKPLEGEEARLAERFGLRFKRGDGPVEDDAVMEDISDIPDDVHISMETAVEGPELFAIRDLAEALLQDIRPVATDRTLAVLLALIEEGAPFETLNWIDIHFTDIDWPNRKATFERYVDAMMALEIPNLHHTVLASDAFQVKYIVKKAVETEPIRTSVLWSVVKDGEDGKVLTIEALEARRGQLGQDVLDILSRIAKDVEGLRGRALAMMKRVEEEGHALAVGHRSIFDPGAGKRFGEMLASNVEIDKKHLEELMDRVKDNPPIVGFPYKELLSRFDVQATMSMLDRWRRDIPKDLEKDLLLAAADRSEGPSKAFEPLHRLATKGHLTEDKDLAARFWKSMTARMDEEREQAERYSCHDGPFDTTVGSSRISITQLSDGAIRPYGFEEAMIGYLDGGYVKAASVAKALPGWAPEHEATKDIVRKAIRYDIACVEKVWEREQEERRRSPSQYYYHDRKALSSVLWSLEDRWKDMQGLAERVGGLDDEIERMKALFALDWPKILKDLSAEGAER